MATTEEKKPRTTMMKTVDGVLGLTEVRIGPEPAAMPMKKAEMTPARAVTR